LNGCTGGGEGGESLRMKGDTVPCRAHGSYGPGDRKAAYGAPSGERVDRKTRPARKAVTVVRRSALHSLGLCLEGRQREGGLSGASKNTVDDARLEICCLKIESVND
jgi:hypothetical protein